MAENRKYGPEIPAPRWNLSAMKSSLATLLPLRSTLPWTLTRAGTDPLHRVLIQIHLIDRGNRTAVTSVNRDTLRLSRIADRRFPLAKILKYQTEVSNRKETSTPWIKRRVIKHYADLKKEEKEEKKA